MNLALRRNVPRLAFTRLATCAGALGCAACLLLAATAAAQGGLKGEHRVWYRYTYGQPELQLVETLSSGDGRWRVQLYFTVRGPGASPTREAGVSLWRPMGPLDFSVGAIWYPLETRWDTWATLAVSWQRP